MLKYVRQGASGVGVPGTPAPQSLRPAVDLRGQAYARLLAELDSRLDRIHVELERLSRELAMAEDRSDGDASRPEPVVDSPVESTAQVEPAISAHLLFVPRPSGYALLAQSGPLPAPGAKIALEELGDAFVVAKLGPAPLPGDTRRCAYLLG
jgi:hypothetical protein